jgi:hypothetical protein
MSPSDELAPRHRGRLRTPSGDRGAPENPSIVQGLNLDFCEKNLEGLFVWAS